jgi:hypothetical protein
MALDSQPAGRFRCGLRLYPLAMRRRLFERKPKRERSLGEYTEPSFRGALLMLVLSIVVLTILWLAYSWAVNQHGIDGPTGVIGRASSSIAALGIR